MLNLTSVMIGTSNIAKMAAFYEGVFERAADMVQENWHGWQIGKGFIGIGEHSEVKGESKEPQRVLFNFETTEVEKEFARIKAVDGAKVIKEPYDMGGAMIATFADPDGNYFQLMTPWDAN